MAIVIMEQGDIQPADLVEAKEFTMAETTFKVDMVEEVAIAKVKNMAPLSQMV